MFGLQEILPFYEARCPMNQLKWRRRLEFWVPLSFLFCFTLSALFFQVLSDIPPWVDRSPIEYFTGGLLWMMSLLCMLCALAHPEVMPRQWAWLLACVALSVLAMDEFFAAHEFVERTEGIDDDHFKVTLWVMTAGVLWLICRAENAPRRIVCTFIVGYIFHSLYILVETGDGNYFRLPLVPIRQLKYSEEVFELLFLSSYWMGLVMLRLRQSRLLSTISQRGFD